MANILVVDDDSHFRDIITRVILRSYTYSVATAASEAEAWNHLSRDAYDLVLLDLFIDGRKSWETLKRIGKLSARPSVIMVSCEDTEENAVFAMSLGAVDFLPKPIHFGRLKTSIDGALGWKRSLARARRGSLGTEKSGGVGEMRVLIVGDEGDRETIRRGLAAAGFDPVEAGDGAEALEIVRRERVDAVLAWIGDGGDAAGTVKAIRESEDCSLRLPLIAVTESDPGAILAALRAGADDFFSIPFDPPILAGKVEAHVRLRREYDRRLEHVVSLCVKDALTGTYNHAYFKARLHEEFGRCLRYKRHLTLALLGLENLHKVRSAFGDAAGDRILAEASRAIQGSIRNSDVLARCGEDEFALIMPEATADRVLRKAGTLRARVEERVASLEDGRKTEVACAVGLASLPLLTPPAASDSGKPAQAPSAEDLLGMANMALTRARVSGSGRVEVFGG
jgi:two-component system, cell cycle response regulator